MSQGSSRFRRGSIKQAPDEHIEGKIISVGPNFVMFKEPGKRARRIPKSTLQINWVQPSTPEEAQIAMIKALLYKEVGIEEEPLVKPKKWR